MKVRKPVVAGRFYPGNAEALRRFLAEATPSAAAPLEALALIAPHAGYVYSGGVAGQVFGAVKIPDTVLLLGPNHTGKGARAAIDSQGAWETPLGRVEIDTALAEALKAACPLFTEDDQAHAFEHSLEVQLPFIQYLNPKARIVPIAFMLRSAGDIQAAGVAIGRVLKEWPSPVLIAVSSDMTHYEPAEVARQKDGLALDEVLALNPQGLLNTVATHRISMCGVIPAAVMLWAVRELGAREARKVAYANSGEASGDFGSVVGYAGVAIPKPTP